MSDDLQSRARAALASRGVKRPDPLQVVAEMRKLDTSTETADDFMAGLRRKVFGE